MYDIHNPCPFIYFIYPCGFLGAEHPQKSESRIAPGLARDNAAIVVQAGEGHVFIL